FNRGTRVFDRGPPFFDLALPLGVRVSPDLRCADVDTVYPSEMFENPGSRLVPVAMAAELVTIEQPGHVRLDEDGIREQFVRPGELHLAGARHDLRRRRRGERHLQRALTPSENRPHFRLA